MRIAGGVIAIVVGIIQVIIAALAVFAVEAVDMADLPDISELTQEQIEQAAESAGMTPEEFQAQFEDIGSAIGWITWVFLIVSIVVVILGIMICASKSPSNGMILAIIGLVLVILAIVWWSGILGLIWNALILLAGILGYMGAKNDSQAVGTV